MALVRISIKMKTSIRDSGNRIAGTGRGFTSSRTAVKYLVSLSMTNAMGSWRLMGKYLRELFSLLTGLEVLWR